MKQYVVAYMAFHDNDITQTIVEAPCIEVAVCRVLCGLEYITVDDKFSSLEEIQNLAFDMDIAITALEI